VYSKCLDRIARARCAVLVVDAMRTRRARAWSLFARKLKRDTAVLSAASDARRRVEN